MDTVVYAWKRAYPKIGNHEKRDTGLGGNAMYSYGKFGCIFDTDGNWLEM